MIPAASNSKLYLGGHDMIVTFYTGAAPTPALQAVARHLTAADPERFTYRNAVIIDSENESEIALGRRYADELANDDEDIGMLYYKSGRLTYYINFWVAPF
jgi:hypothetical protein